MRHPRCARPGSASAAVARVALRLGLLACLLALAPQPGLASSPDWDATSGIQIQALDPEGRQSIVTDFLNLDRRDGVRSLQRPGVDAGAAANVYLPGEATLPRGGYAARILSDGRIGSLVRTDDGASPAASIYRRPEPAEQLLLPLVLERYRRQSSRLSIQNASSQAAVRLRLELVALGRVRPLVSLALTLPPAGVERIDLAHDPRLAALPESFLGHAVLKAEPGGAVAAVAEVDVEDGARSLYALEAQPLEAADQRVILPHVRHTPPRVSGIAVLNPGPEPAELELRYHALPGPNACGPSASWTHHARPLPLPPGRLEILYSAAQDATGQPIVPPGCLAWAELSSRGGAILAAVVEAEIDAAGSPSRAAAYSGLGAQRAARELFLPLFRRRHGPAQLGTPFFLVNPGPEPAELVVTARDACGAILACDLGCSLRIPAGQGRTWHPDALPAPPGRSTCHAGPGLFGSAEVRSDQPLVLVAYDEPRLGSGDFAAYDALPRPPEAPGTRYHTELLPSLTCRSPDPRSIGCRRP